MAIAKTKVKDGKAAAERDPAQDKASKAEARLRAHYTLGEKGLALVKDGKHLADTLRKLERETGYGSD